MGTVGRLRSHFLRVPPFPPHVVGSFRASWVPPGLGHNVMHPPGGCGDRPRIHGPSAPGQRLRRDSQHEFHPLGFRSLDRVSVSGRLFVSRTDCRVATCIVRDASCPPTLPHGPHRRCRVRKPPRGRGENVKPASGTLSDGPRSGFGSAMSTPPAGTACTSRRNSRDNRDTVRLNSAASSRFACNRSRNDNVSETTPNSAPVMEITTSISISDFPERLAWSRTLRRRLLLAPIISHLRESTPTA